MSALRLASIALIAGVMASEGRAQADTDIAAGKIRNWIHGAQALAIMDFEDSSALRNIGTIDAEGQIVMEPIVPPPSQQTVSQTFDTCRANTVQIVNGSTGITPIVPLALSGDGNERALAIADSEEMAVWRLNHGQAPMTKGTYLQLVYAEGEAEVQGICSWEILVPSGDAEVTVEYAIRFRPGWNLIRNRIVDFIESWSGADQETYMIIDTVDVLPEDVAWFSQ
ncbi:MAG: hypothetical protein U0S50_11905 [Sphingopyxis sp.]|uniref:hypothetical protein n=1 Tax=unclassified Sphingopyxis TaxID=2614943 RepID=UPI000CDF324B|nr:MULTISPECIES: hypothetical protein [unclassified Sphingopyxis]AVA15053.1 hypothetical protein C3E99_15405 [Sphingopyxis sp. MG]MDZ3832504.1 hypothetical protein [Sphingopyxis sp.]